MSSQAPLNGTSIAALLAAQAAHRGSEIFLRTRDTQLGFAELQQSVLRLAAGLSAIGVRRGSRVALMLPNCIEFVQIVFAVAHLGAVLVPLNTAYRGRILGHVLEKSAPMMLIVDETLLNQVIGQYEGLASLAGIVVRRRSAGSPFPILSLPGFDLSALPEGGAVDADPAVPGPDDLQAILFTSGTTGLSKGVMVPNALSIESARTFLSLVAHEEGETIYCPLPLFHASGLWEGLIAPLMAGSPVALVERFSVSRFWSDVRAFDARIAMGVFSMVPILLNQTPGADDRDHPLRAYYTGKSSHDAEFTRRFGVRCVENYASTEAGIPIASRYGEWVPGSCGRPCLHTHEVMIVDAWDREVPHGSVGEIVVRPRRPFTVTPGYYRDADATARCFRNLWFHTGDLAWRDPEGNHFIVDRIKDSIRRRGENISAFEVEQGVNSHPDVLESAAIAVPSEFEEDEVMVVVVARPGREIDPADLVRHCAVNLPEFMVPRYVEAVDELPRNSVGKVAKQELRERGERGITPSTWERPSTRRDAAPARGPAARGRSD